MSEDQYDKRMWSQAKRLSGLSDRAWAWLPEDARLAYRRQAQHTGITAVFRRYVADPSTSEVYLHQHSGERVTVIGELGTLGVAYDRDDTGDILRVRFADGTFQDVFLDELSDWNGPERR